MQIKNVDMSINLIVLGLSPTAKYVGKEGYLIGANCLGFGLKKGAAYHSKYFKTTQIVTEEEFVGILEGYLNSNEKKYYVCPTTDEWVEFIGEHPIFQNDRVIVDNSYLDKTYVQLADKKQLQILSNQLRLNYPKSITFTVGEGIPSTDDFLYPLFCKPTNRSGIAHVMQGKKGWIINTFDDLSVVSKISGLEGRELIVQEIIEGEETNIKVLAMVSSVSWRTTPWVGCKARQYPTGFGSGSLVIKESNEVNEELINIANQLLDKSGYKGFFSLEAKYCNRRKKLYIIEVNTRPSLWYSATTTSNYQLVTWWLNALGNKKNQINENVKHVPVVWQYWYKDIFASLTTNANNIKYPNNKLKSYAVWDAKDLKPFLFDIWNGFKQFIKRNIE
jgi:predicted ATP-grasp superfamily ATP-dependent carboligase